MDAFPLASELLGKSASAYEHLRRAISRGQLRPGRRLSATALAATFRISETPVREALVRLSAEGFLAWEAGKGHFTKPVSLQEQSDLHDMIAICLNRCLQQLEHPGLDLLEAAKPATSREQPWPIAGLDADEHATQMMARLGAVLADCNGNAVLQSTMSTMMDRTQLIRRLALDTPEQIGLVQDRIERFASAVRAADRTSAMAIVGQHLAERRTRLPELVEAAGALVDRATYP